MRALTMHSSKRAKTCIFQTRPPNRLPLLLYRTVSKKSHTLGTQSRKIISTLAVNEER